MSHDFYWHRPGCGYPMQGSGAAYSPWGYVSSMHPRGLPFFGPYRQGPFPHTLGYPAAPMPPMHDEDVCKLVKDYLTSDPRLVPGADITVSISNGVATLTGTTPDKWTKYFAGEDCFNVPSVVDVVNDLRIGEEQAEEKPRRPRRRPRKPD